MKKIFALLLSIAVVFSSMSALCYSVEDAYEEFNSQHSAFVKSLTDYGIKESDIISFLYDVYDYVLEMHSYTPVTEENFEENALKAITRVSAREQYYPIQDALLILYPDSIRAAVSDGTVTKEFKPLVETVKKIIFENNMLGSVSDKTFQSSDGGTTSTPPSVSTTAFTDIDSSHWAYSAVSHLADNFILNGYLDGSFKPDANITRGEFAKIIVSATNTYDYTAASSFSDVSKDAWYYAYVSSAMKNGFITGYPDGSFRPDDNITRADICTIVYRCIKSKISAGNIAAFSDDNAIPAYAKEAVYALNSKGIVNGLGNGIFAPQTFATRAQTAKIVYQAIFNN